MGLIDTVTIVVTHRGGITLVRIERLYTITVIAVQSVGRTDPHISTRIPEDIIDLRTRQSIGRIQTTELHIRNKSCLSRYTEANGKQT